jgi:hypothetical protein
MTGLLMFNENETTESEYVQASAGTDRSCSFIFLHASSRALCFLHCSLRFSFFILRINLWKGDNKANQKTIECLPSLTNNMNISKLKRKEERDFLNVKWEGK